jgi:UDP-N-acetylglucosamine--N-acetylmuramyl-(pentapeptide) pyrophosphoryl-undecaprenol N-acetylglucosamine transferase
MQQKAAHKKIIISGGGTGGHVFPAIAIADALCLELRDPEILFVGAKGRMEMEKVPEAGYRIVGLPVEGFRRKLSLANLRVIVKLVSSLNMAGKIIREFSPDAVVGVGGYVSGPVLRKAAGMGIPTLIQEQNSFAGVTNRLLAKKVRKICVAYEGMEKYFPAGKLVLAGNPVRREIRAALGIDPAATVLLVLGGSLGARSINRAVAGGLKLIIDSGITLIWQCGKYYFEEARQSLRGIPSGRIILKDFISRMDQAYLAADAIIARAGAITISELCHVGKPVILVPSPNVAEDHQTKNAEALAIRSAAILIPDPEASERMIPEALELLCDRSRMNKLSGNISGLAIDDSAGRIAREVIEIMST